MSDVNGPQAASGQVIRLAENQSADRTPAAEAQNKPASQANPAQAQFADQVSLTPAAEQLQRLEKVVAKADPVDQEKVDAVKQAIANGTFTVDNNAVAEKFIDLEKSLFTGR